jgi:putative FmdB family regulatory protein
MPIYEYRCEQGHTFEVLQRMSDDPVAVCQSCDAPAQRVFHAPAVHFKGSGFYNTDYGTRKRSRELKEAAEGNGKASSSKDGSGAKTSETKAKTESKATTSTSGSGSGSGSD